MKFSDDIKKLSCLRRYPNITSSGQFCKYSRPLWKRYISPDFLAFENLRLMKQVFGGYLCYIWEGVEYDIDDTDRYGEAVEQEDYEFNGCYCATHIEDSYIYILLSEQFSYINFK